MLFLKRKALVYITRGDRLLVFRHPQAPDAGVQVPGGTVGEGETPEEAALREAREETGLAALTPVAFLGEQVRDMRDLGKNDVHHRFFFHLRCDEPAPERWLHREPDPAEGGEPPLFELFWVHLPDALPALAGDQGVLLPRLIERLQADQAQPAQ